MILETQSNFVRVILRKIKKIPARKVELLTSVLGVFMDNRARSISKSCEYYHKFWPAPLR